MVVAKPDTDELDEHSWERGPNSGEAVVFTTEDAPPHEFVHRTMALSAAPLAAGGHRLIAGTGANRRLLLGCPWWGFNQVCAPDTGAIWAPTPAEVAQVQAECEFYAADVAGRRARGHADDLVGKVRLRGRAELPIAAPAGPMPAAPAGSSGDVLGGPCPRRGRR